MLFANSFESEICLEWIGGVGYNTSVPSETQIDVCLAAAPQRREEPAQRTSAFLSSGEENGEDRCWSAALRLDRFRLAEAPARDYESVGVPRSCELDATSLRMVALGMGILNLFTAFCQASSGTDARSGVQAETIWDA